MIEFIGNKDPNIHFISSNIHVAQFYFFSHHAQHGRIWAFFDVLCNVHYAVQRRMEEEM